MDDPSEEGYVVTLAMEALPKETVKIMYDDGEGNLTPANVLSGELCELCPMCLGTGLCHREK